MHIEAAKRETRRLIRSGIAVMWSSGSGTGKSSGQMQIAEEIKAAHKPGEVGIGVTFAANMSPIDNMGVPFKGTHTFPMPDGTERTINVTDPTVPLWQISLCGRPAFTFRKYVWICEEYGQGNDDSKRGLSEIFLSGGTSYWSGPRGFPPGSVRLAATNEGTRYGVTRDFDFAVARRCKLFIDGNVDVTLAHWDKPYTYQGKTWEVLPYTKAWAKRRGELLFQPEPKVQGPWGNPRSICMVDRYIQTVMEDFGGKVPVTNKDEIGPITETIRGMAGQEVATSYIQDLIFLTELPSYEDVVADPVNVPMPVRADLNLLMVYELAFRTQADHLPQVIQFINRLPRDMSIAFVKSLLRRDYKNMINHPSMDQWINKHAHLLAIIGSLTQ